MLLPLTAQCLWELQFKLKMQWHSEIAEQRAGKARGGTDTPLVGLVPVYGQAFCTVR
jgi:hypothetical protein